MRRRTRQILRILSASIIVIILLYASIPYLLPSSFSIKRYWLDRQSIFEGETAILTISAEHTDGKAHNIMLYFTPNKPGMYITDLMGSRLPVTGNATYIQQLRIPANLSGVVISFHVSARLPNATRSLQYTIALQVDIDGKTSDKTWSDVSIFVVKPAS